jgi:hypothetical protein
MDCQDAPTLQFGKKWKKNQEELTKIVQDHDERMQQRIRDLREMGYSDKDIDEVFSF